MMRFVFVLCTILFLFQPSICSVFTLQDDKIDYKDYKLKKMLFLQEISLNCIWLDTN